MNKELIELLEKLSVNSKRMTEQEIKFRGVFIQLALDVEQLIDECLSLYFFPKDKIKRNEFYQLILGGESTTFGAKSKILSSLYKNKFSEFNDKYNEDIKTFRKKLSSEKKKKYPTLDMRIENFIPLRNKLAHRKVGQDVKAINNYNEKGMYLEIGIDKNEVDNVGKLYFNNEFTNMFIGDYENITAALEELKNIIKAQTAT